MNGVVFCASSELNLNENQRGKQQQQQRKKFLLIKFRADTNEMAD